MKTSSFILSLSSIGLAYSVKLATYNTYQLFTHSNAPKLFPQQVPAVLESDVDVFCFQELNLQRDMDSYGDAIESLYPNQFSELDITDAPTASSSQCTQEQLDVLNGPVAQYCAQYFDGSAAFAYCLAAAAAPFGQPDAYDILAYSPCAGCLGIFGGVQPQLTQLYPELNLENATSFCSATPEPFQSLNYNVLDGLLIATKEGYDILDQWSFELPSWLFLPRRVNVAQICVSEGYDGECEQSIIFGCTHLGATGFASDTGTPQLPSQIGSESISSHVGLNRLQSQKVVDEIFNENILDTLGIDEDDNNVVGVFLAGDINTGQMFNRCDVDGADNCVAGVDEPLNPFQVFTDSGLIDAPDLMYPGGPPKQPDILCTSCLNEASDDYNPLADDDSGQFISDPETSRDLDHILVQDGFCRFKPVSLERAFLEKYDDLIEEGQSVPASDHYAVVLEVDFSPPRGQGGMGNRPRGYRGRGGRGPRRLRRKGAKGKGPGRGGRSSSDGGKSGDGTCRVSPPPRPPTGNGGFGGRGGKGPSGKGRFGTSNGMMDIQNELSENGLNGENNTNTVVISQQMVYGIIGVVALLLIINVICLGYQNCCVNQKKRQYSKVAFTSDEEI